MFFGACPRETQQVVVYMTFHQRACYIQVNCHVFVCASFFSPHSRQAQDAVLFQEPPTRFPRPSEAFAASHDLGTSLEEAPSKRKLTSRFLQLLHDHRVCLTCGFLPVSGWYPGGIRWYPAVSGWYPGRIRGIRLVSGWYAGDICLVSGWYPGGIRRYPFTSVQRAKAPALPRTSPHPPPPSPLRRAHPNGAAMARAWPCCFCSDCKVSAHISSCHGSSHKAVCRHSKGSLHVLPSLHSAQHKPKSSYVLRGQSPKNTPRRARAMRLPKTRLP